MHNPFRLRRAGIALAGAALLLAGAAGASAAGGPQPGSKQLRPNVAAGALANPAMAPGSELRFIAVEPCRILDTRVAGGALNNSSRTFSAVAPYAAQGGNGAGCGIPASAVSVEVNLGAISQANTAGFVKGWAAGAAEPNASLINYDPSGPVANQVTIPLSGTGTFTLKSNRNAQVFADAAGYWVKPLYVSIDAASGVAVVYAGIESGFVGVVRDGVGSYEVTFDRNVSSCVPAATDYLFGSIHEISVDTDFSQDSTVFVDVKNSSTGVQEDTIFHLSLTC